MGPQEIPVEELLARAEAKGYRQGAHRAEDGSRNIITYQPKTLRDQGVALKLYEKWVGILEQNKQDVGETQCGSGAPAALSLGKDSPLPDIATIMDFIRFHAALGKGLLDENGLITADSSNIFTEWFFAGFARVTGSRVEKKVRKAAYHFTRTILVDEGVVSGKRKPKYLFGKKEFIQFTKTFWTTDNSIFVHPRNKVQAPFIISVFCWTGARIGAFFPNADNKDKAGLRYRDVEVILKRVPSGGWKSIYRIDQRWVKNNRDPENTV